MQSTSLNRFREAKGPDGGNTNSVFYAACVFFEKIRVKEGKPKSKHRQEMEAAWGDQGGFDTKTPVHNKFMWVKKGEEGIGINSLGERYIYT
ncbi:hypothetical protein AAFC00_003646 [Neodothiora populina]|uniref:DUF7726 domain-containing protein n=1 Tax=Neodothiora populina TaxID=2781224 RepID=A0ABR3PEZ9_9PEZI